MRRELRHGLFSVLLYGAAWALMALFLRERDGELHLVPVVLLAFALPLVIAMLGASASPLSTNYFHFLGTTPWAPGRRLPFGAYAPHAGEATQLIMIVLLTWGEGWFTGSIFLGCSCLLTVGFVLPLLLRSGAWWLSSLLLTSVGGLMAMSVTLQYFYLGTILLLVCCWWCERRVIAIDWRRQCTEPPHEHRLSLNFGTTALAPTAYRTPIAFKWRFLLGVSIGATLLGADLCVGRVVDEGGFKEHGISLLAGSAQVLFFGMLRAKHRHAALASPLTLLTRIRRRKFVIPGYDQFLMPVLMGVATLIVGMWSLQFLNSPYLIAITVTAGIIVSMTIGPPADAWRLTSPGEVRLVPLYPPMPRPAR